MVLELKKAIESEKVFFGIRESLKNMKKLDKVILSSDYRGETRDILMKNKMDYKIIEFSKEQITDKFALNFKCEVFGLKK